MPQEQASLSHMALTGQTNSEKLKRGIYSIWLQWEEEQPAPPPSLASTFSFYCAYEKYAFTVRKSL